MLMILMYFEELMEKTTSENKEVFLMGDFNIDLLKIEEANHVNDFYDIITTNLFVSQQFQVELLLA